MKRNEKQLQEKKQAIQDTMFVHGGRWKLPIIYFPSMAETSDLMTFQIPSRK